VASNLRQPQIVRQQSLSQSAAGRTGARDFLEAALAEVDALRVEAPGGAVPFQMNVERELHGDARVKAGVERGAAVAKTRAESAIGQFGQRQLPALNEDAAVETRWSGKLEAIDGGIDEATGAAAFERGLAEQRPAFQSAPDDESAGRFQHGRKAPCDDLVEHAMAEVEAGRLEVGQHDLEVADQSARQEVAVVKGVAVLDQWPDERFVEEPCGEGAPKQGDRGHPFGMGQ